MESFKKKSSFYFLINFILYEVTTILKFKNISDLGIIIIGFTYRESNVLFYQMDNIIPKEYTIQSIDYKMNLSLSKIYKKDI